MRLTEAEYHDLLADRTVKERKRRADPEYQAQAAVIEWVEWMAKQDPRLTLLYAIPNGGARSKAEAGKLKAEGVRAGMPDLCLPIAGIKRDGYHNLGIAFYALYIEMKSAKGKLSSDQKRVIAGLRAAGNRVEVCRSADEAIRVIQDYLGMEK